MDKVVCYTCVTGGYEVPPPPPAGSAADFLCFTDGPAPEGWTALPVPEELSGLDQVRRQRAVKICAHRYLPSDYLVSVWSDGNVAWLKDPAGLPPMCDFTVSPLYVRVHPARRCVYEEAEAVRRMGKEDPAVLARVLARYRDGGFPENAGLAETNILVRRHFDPSCRRFCDRWASEVMLWSKRDQLSFPYAARELGFVYGTMPWLYRGDGSSGWFGTLPHGRARRG